MAGQVGWAASISVWHHGVDRVAFLEVLGNEIVARLAEADLQHRRDLRKRKLERICLVAHLLDLLKLVGGVGGELGDGIHHTLDGLDNHVIHVF